jgi:hypothetical protein
VSARREKHVVAPSIRTEVKRLPVILAVCVPLVIAVAVLRFLFGEVFSVATRAQLSRGMTTNEVLGGLGPPNEVSGDHWVYTKTLMYNVGIVSFDPSGHLTSAVND